MGSLFLGRGVQMLYCAVAWLWGGATFFPLITLILGISSLKPVYERLEEFICFPLHTNRSQSHWRYLYLINLHVLLSHYKIATTLLSQSTAPSLAPRACEILQCHKGCRLQDYEVDFCFLQEKWINKINRALRMWDLVWRDKHWDGEHHQWCLFGIKCLFVVLGRELPASFQPLRQDDSEAAF